MPPLSPDQTCVVASIENCIENQYLLKVWNPVLCLRFKLFCFSPSTSLNCHKNSAVRLSGNNTFSPLFTASIQKNIEFWFSTILAREE